MLIVIDVGNTNTVLGLFDGKHLLHDWRIRTEIDHTIDEYGVLIYNLYLSTPMKAKEMRSVTAIIISCVVPPMLNILEPLCIKYFNIKPLIVGPGIKTGMPIFYDNPKEVGADRIVNAVAAYEKYHKECIIVDFGTATTFDYISPKGEYMGGCIAPGIVISSELFLKRLLNCRGSNSVNLKLSLPKIQSAPCRRGLCMVTRGLWTVLSIE